MPSFYVVDLSEFIHGIMGKLILSMAYSLIFKC